MAPSQPSTGSASRGLLARPLDALVFLAPLIIFYELTSLLRHGDRVIAFDLMRQFFELFGYVGRWAPGLGVVAILLSTHVVSGEKWAVRWSRVAFMYVEAAIFAIPLLALNWAIPLVGGGGGPDALLDRVAVGVGAGIYEELVFRLILISLVMIVAVDLLRLDRAMATFAAFALSALAFAMHHHQPFGNEPFDATFFVFRTVAGVYLAAIFWYRGYGSAAGCHAAYNVALASVGSAVA